MPDKLSVLTAREREIFNSLVAGFKVKDIAVNLNLSVKTVEAHKFNLMQKLDVHRTAHLARFATPQRAETPVQRETPDHPIIEGSTNP
jgi:two-component system, NarL family, response regulator NreC